jgi:hypothetical protein
MPSLGEMEELKNGLDGKIMTLGLQLLLLDGIFQMAPMTHVVAIGSPEWQLTA